MVRVAFWTVTLPFIVDEESHGQPFGWQGEFSKHILDKLYRLGSCNKFPIECVDVNQF